MPLWQHDAMKDDFISFVKQKIKEVPIDWDKVKEPVFNLDRFDPKYHECLTGDLIFSDKPIISFGLIIDNADRAIIDLLNMSKMANDIMSSVFG